MSDRTQTTVIHVGERTTLEFTHSPESAWVLETPRGFVTTANRILVFTDLEAAVDVARDHTADGGVLFWQGTLDSWRDSAKEAGVPIVLVGP